jgi:hypothetical protein
MVRTPLGEPAEPDRDVCAGLRDPAGPVLDDCAVHPVATTNTKYTKKGKVTKSEYDSFEALLEQRNVEIHQEPEPELG